MPFSLEPYTYLPLNEATQEIRLLTLLPGPPDADICILLENVPFPATTASSLNFEALSYAWGSEEHPRKVFIGQSLQVLSITRNLADALVHIRKPDASRVLWVDAICVNQKDLIERGSQVKRMVEIFANASLVVAWLGLGTVESAKALEILSLIGSRVSVNWDTDMVERSRDSPSMDSDERYLHNCEDLNILFNFDKRQIKSLDHLLGRSWFERLWIWQEVWLAKKSILQCGTEMVPWETFGNAMYLLEYKGFSIPAEMNTISMKIRNAFCLCYIGTKSVKLLFYFTRNSKCQDPRDRVYAILSLLDQLGIELRVEPDYTKSIFDVYRDVTLRLLIDYQTLDVFSTIEMTEQDRLRGTENWSSWTPNFAKPRLSQPILGGSFAASYSSANIFYKSPVIYVAGVVVAKIDDINSYDPPDWDPLFPQEYEEIQAIENLLRVVQQLSQGQLLSSESVSSLCRTIIGGEFRERRSPPSETNISFKAARNALQTFLDNHLQGLPASTRNENEKLFLAIVDDCCTGRSIFQTTTGQFGFAPRTSQKGDILVVLLGCTSPLILRPTGSQYQIVGESYCDGYMNGEALLNSLPANIELVMKETSKTGVDCWAYRNTLTGEMHLEDPRLGDLPPGWTRHRHELDHLYNLYLNGNGSNKATHFDPRLTTACLRERGIDVKFLEII